jgi:hypothetical protein
MRRLDELSARNAALAASDPTDEGVRGIPPSFSGCLRSNSRMASPKRTQDTWLSR